LKNKKQHKIYFFSNRIFTEGVCKLSDLIITDLIDEDQYLYQRISPIPTLIFGTMSFLSKPGETVASIFSSKMNHFIENYFLILIICSLSQILLWNHYRFQRNRQFII